MFVVVFDMFVFVIVKFVVIEFCLEIFVFLVFGKVGIYEYGMVLVLDFFN